MARYRKVRVAASAGVLLAGTWGTSLAVFTDTGTTTASFTAGEVALSTTPSETVFNLTDLAPGDVEFASLAVANDGSLDLRYAMTSAPSGALADALQVAVWSGSACDAAELASTFPLATGTLAGGLAFGSAAMGAQPGDRTLAPGAGETLCFRVELPTATGNEYQGASASATFTFDAEQTENNP